MASFWVRCATRMPNRYDSFGEGAGGLCPRVESREGCGVGGRDGCGLGRGRQKVRGSCHPEASM